MNPRNNTATVNNGHFEVQTDVHLNGTTDIVDGVRSNNKCSYLLWVIYVESSTSVYSSGYKDKETFYLPLEDLLDDKIMRMYLNTMIYKYGNGLKY